MPADRHGVVPVDRLDAGERALWGPAALAPRDASPHASVPDEPMAPTSPTLLAVTSDPVVRDAIDRIARLNLFDVVFASDPAHALASAYLRRPSAAVVEHGPVGLEVARGLRGLLGSGLPCSFVADGGSVRERVEAAEAGATLYLTRPIDPEVFTLAIRQMMASAEESVQRALIVGGASQLVRALCRSTERRGLGVVLAEAEGCIDALRAATPDVVVLVADRGGLPARDLCRAIRTSAEWQDLPIVVAGTTTDEAIHALAAGADDALPEGTGVDSVAALAAVRAQRARRLRERLDADALTGLMRRRGFLEALTRSLAACARSARSLALVLCDVDHFKAINDRYGHESGDHVLAAFGRLLAKSFRAQDLRGRWGGEEFILAFPGETAESVRQPVESAFRALAKMPFVIGEKGPFTVTCSAGAATAPFDGTSIDVLLRVADRRLYSAKRGGRARVVASG